MSNIDDAQTDAIYNAKGVAVPAATAQPSGTPLTVSPTTATAFQISTKRDAMLYINVRTAAALAIAMGPTSSCDIAVSASQSDALGTTSLRVPAGWYVKLTGTMANLACTAVLL